MCQWPMQQPGWVKSWPQWRQWLLWIQGSGLKLKLQPPLCSGRKKQKLLLPTQSYVNSKEKKKKTGKAESLPDNTFTSTCNLTEDRNHPAPFAGSPKKGSGSTWIRGVWADEQDWGVCTGRHWVQMPWLSLADRMPGTLPWAPHSAHTWAWFGCISSTARSFRAAHKKTINWSLRHRHMWILCPRFCPCPAFPFSSTLLFPCYRIQFMSNFTSIAT